MPRSTSPLYGLLPGFLVPVFLISGLLAQKQAHAVSEQTVHSLRLVYTPDQAYDRMKAGADRLVMARRQYRVLELRKRVRAAQGSRSEPKPAAGAPYKGPKVVYPLRIGGVTVPKTVRELNLKPAKKPDHAGSYIAAVISCADSREATADLFIQNRTDLLLMASPGPIVRPAEVALLEHAATKHGLSLCVILVHSKCAILDHATSPQTDQPSQAQRHLTIETRQSTGIAAQSGRSLEEAHALRQAQAIYRLSPMLKARHKAGTFEVAIALLEEQSQIRAQGKRIRWIAPWMTAPPARVEARPSK